MTRTNKLELIIASLGLASINLLLIKAFEVFGLITGINHYLSFLCILIISFSLTYVILKFSSKIFTVLLGLFFILVVPFFKHYIESTVIPDIFTDNQISPIDYVKWNEENYIYLFLIRYVILLTLIMVIVNGIIQRKN